MAMRARSVLVFAVAGALLAGCAGSRASPSEGPTTPATPSAAAVLPPSTSTPMASASPTVPGRSPQPYVAPGRAPLTFAGPTVGDRIIVGGLLADGAYRVAAGEPSEPPVVIGSISAIADRLPAPWTLAGRSERAAVSDTGYLAVAITGGEGADAAGVAVFDLTAPTEEPLIIPSTAGGFQIAGDRLWLQTGGSTLAVHDLPSPTPRSLELPAGVEVVDDLGVPFFLNDAGDAVLITGPGRDAAGARLLGLTSVERPVAGEGLLATTGRVPFDPSGGVIRDGEDCTRPAAGAADICVVWPNGAVLGYLAGDDDFGPAWASTKAPLDLVEAAPGSDCEAAWVSAGLAGIVGPGRQCAIWPPGTEMGFDLPGDLIDAAWDPREDYPVWVTTDGLGTIRQGTPEMSVELGDWQPRSIAGFWANTVLLAADQEPRVALGVTGPDAITKLPMSPDSIVPLPGDVLLRVVPGELEDES